MIIYLCSLVMEKILWVTIFWIFAALEVKGAKLEDSSSVAKHHLEFLGHRKNTGDPDVSAH